LTFLQTISAPGEIRELRAFVGDAEGSILSGRFDDLEAMARTAIDMSAGHDWDGFGGVTAVYVTVNAIEPEAAKRIGDWTANSMKVRARSTRNQDIFYRTWLVIDLDPVRPTGVCSTTEEKSAALAVSLNVREFLKELGWGEPTVVDSGSGYHLWYRADNLLAFGNDWQQALKHISRIYSTETVTIDTSIGNSARILRLPGTMNRKGEDTKERPHRICKVLSYPEQFVPVTYNMVRDLAIREGALKSRRNDAERPALVDDVEDRISEFCKDYDIEIVDEFDKDDGMRYFVLDRCPFKGEPHRGDPNKSTITLSSTAVGFSCLGGSCKAKGSSMKELRGYLYQQTGHRSRVRFYKESEAKLEHHFEQWMAEEYKALENLARLRPEIVYDEATYDAMCLAEKYKGTPDEATDPAAFGFNTWDSLAYHFFFWAVRVEREFESEDDRKTHTDRCWAVGDEENLLEAGRLMGEMWLVFSTRQRERPKEWSAPALERKYGSKSPKRPLSALEFRMVLHKPRRAA
jgi:hypothetical protein